MSLESQLQITLKEDLEAASRSYVVVAEIAESVKDLNNSLFFYNFLPNISKLELDLAETRAELYNKLRDHIPLKKARKILLEEHYTGKSAVEIIKSLLVDGFTWEHIISFFPPNFELRPSQILAFQNFANAIQETSNGEELVIEKVTGTGKGLLLAVITELLPPSMQTLVVVPTIAIARQTIKNFENYCPNKSISYFFTEDAKLNKNYPRGFDGEIVVMVQQSVVIQGNSEAFPKGFKPGLVIVDESHLLTVEARNTIANNFPDTLQLDLTATHFKTSINKLPGSLPIAIGNAAIRWILPKDLPKGRVVHTDNFGQLLHSREICPIIWNTLEADIDFNLLEIDTEEGEFKEASVERVLQTSWQNITNTFASKYNEPESLLGKRKRTLVVCPNSIKLTKQAAENFSDINFDVRTAIVTSKECLIYYRGEVIKSSEEPILEEFKSGEIKVVFNIRKWREGVDIPLIDSVVHLTMFNKDSDYLQSAGRGLRTAIGKLNVLITELVSSQATNNMVANAMTVFGILPTELEEARDILDSSQEETEGKRVENKGIVTINYGKAIEEFYRTFVSFNEIKNCLKEYFSSAQMATFRDSLILVKVKECILEMYSKGASLENLIYPKQGLQLPNTVDELPDNLIKSSKLNPQIVYIYLLQKFKDITNEEIVAGRRESEQEQKTRYVDVLLQVALKKNLITSNEQKLQREKFSKYSISALKQYLNNLELLKTLFRRQSSVDLTPEPENKVNFENPLKKLQSHFEINNAEQLLLDNLIRIFLSINPGFENSWINLAEIPFRRFFKKENFSLAEKNALMLFVIINFKLSILNNSKSVEIKSLIEVFDELNFPPSKIVTTVKQIISEHTKSLEEPELVLKNIFLYLDFAYGIFNKEIVKKFITDILDEPDFENTLDVEFKALNLMGIGVQYSQESKKNILIKSFGLCFDPNSLLMNSLISVNKKSNLRQFAESEKQAYAQKLSRLVFKEYLSGYISSNPEGEEIKINDTLQTFLDTSLYKVNILLTPEIIFLNSSLKKYLNKGVQLICQNNSKISQSSARYLIFSHIKEKIETELKPKDGVSIFVSMQELVAYFEKAIENYPKNPNLTIGNLKLSESQTTLIFNYSARFNLSRKDITSIHKMILNFKASLNQKAQSVIKELSEDELLEIIKKMIAKRTIYDKIEKFVNKEYPQYHSKITDFIKNKIYNAIYSLYDKSGNGSQQILDQSQETLEKEVTEEVTLNLFNSLRTVDPELYARLDKTEILKHLETVKDLIKNKQFCDQIENKILEQHYVKFVLKNSKLGSVDVPRLFVLELEKAYNSLQQKNFKTIGEINLSIKRLGIHLSNEVVEKLLSDYVKSIIISSTVKISDLLAADTYFGNCYSIVVETAISSEILKSLPQKTSGNIQLKEANKYRKG